MQNQKKDKFDIGDLVLSQSLSSNKKLLGIVVGRGEDSYDPDDIYDFAEDSSFVKDFLIKVPTYLVYFGVHECIMKMLETKIEIYEECDPDHVLWRESVV